MVVHAWHEERHEFPRRREAVPTEELRQMTREVRVAQETAGAEPAPCTQTTERVRDSLREISREVTV
jgi:hypothetical protein